MTPQENLRRALLNDEFPDDAPEDRLFSPTGTDALRQNRNIALSAWMTQVSGQDINAGSPTWQQDKDALVQGYFKNPTASNVSDDEIHGLVRSHIQTTEEAATMAADGALIGEALPSVLSAVRGKRGASQLRPIFDRYEQDAMRRHTALSIKLAPYRNLVNQVSGELRKEMESEVPTTDKLESMAERLLSVNPEDRPLVLKAIGATGGKDAKERASYLSKLAGAMGRMAETMGGSVESVAARLGGTIQELADAPAAIAGLLSGGTSLQGEAATAKARSEESAAMRDKIDNLTLLTQQIRTVADQEINPIKGDAWYSQIGIDVARMIPQSAVTIANPAIGLAANWAYFENTIAGEAMLQDPNLTPQQARSIAGISAPINAAVETFTALIPFGRVKLPFVQKWLQSTATSIPTAAARFGVRAAVGTAGEIVEEYAQSAAPLIAQKLLGALQKDMPAVDWENRMPKFADIAAQTWGPALVFSLVGAGSVSISEVNSGRALAGDVDLMVATGLAPAKAQSIATAAESNNWQQVDTLFREDFVKPEKATDTEKAEATQRFLAKIQAHQEMETINAKEAEKIGGVRIFRDDEGWNVELADGSIIKTDSADAARRYRDELYLTELDHEAESMIALSDDLVKAFPGTRLELREEVLEADSDGLTLRSLTTGKTTVIKDAKSLENLWREASAVGFQSGKRTAQAVLGDNFMEFGKSIARVFQRGRGSNDAPAAITAMHEVIEAAWRKGVMAGQWSVEGTRQIIATLVPTLEAGIANLGKETQSQELLWLENAKKAAAEGDEDLIREVFVEMAVRTWIGRDRDGNKTGLRPGTILRALNAAVLQESDPENITMGQKVIEWFKSIGAYLKGVIATANIIRSAERNGAIDDFTGFLDKVLGIETATREENEVKDGVIDMAFSLAPELKDGSTFSLAGPNAEIPQFMRDSLVTAQAMAKEGKDSETIRAITGWFPGKYDDKMRWEVPDNKARLNVEPFLKSVSGLKQAKLGEVLDHPSLFAAYPEAKEIFVSAEYGQPGGSFWKRPNGEPAISLFWDVVDPERAKLAFERNPTEKNRQRMESNRYEARDEMLSTLLHEVQHWIQVKEGFAKGSSPEAQNERFGFLRSRLNYLESTDEYKAGLALIDRAWNAFDKVDFSGDQGEAATTAYNAAEKTVEQIYRDNSTLREARKVTQELQKLSYGQLQFSAKNAYRRTAGEIESRDVQARQSFTPEQRKAIAPYSSENIAKEDAIVIFGGTGSTFSLAPTEIIGQTGLSPAISVKGKPYIGRPGMTHAEILGDYVWRKIFTPQQRRDDPNQDNAIKYAHESWMDSPDSGFDDFGFLDALTGKVFDREASYKLLKDRGFATPDGSYSTRYESLDSSDLFNSKPVGSTFSLAPTEQDDSQTEPGELAPDSDVESLPIEEGENIPWTQETSFSLAPQFLPTVFKPFNKEIKNKILSETKTIASIHIDRMKVGEFAGVPLQGGMFYSSIVENLKKRIAWAFNADNIARGVARRAAQNGGYVKLVLMQEGNVIGNKTFGTIWFKQLEESIALKKISKAAALKELNRVRDLYAVHPKSEIATGHTKPWKTIDEAREAIINMPQKKRGATYFQKSKTKTIAEGEKIAYQALLSKKMTSLGFPDAINIVSNIEEESFKGVPTGAVVGIVKFDPVPEDEKIQTATEAGVPEHLSYKYVLKGEPVARMMTYKVIDETFPEIAGKMLSQQHTNFEVEKSLSFSLSPQSGIDIVSDTLESWQDVFDKAAKRNPARAMAIRDLAQQRINRLGEMWAADRWTAKGDKIRAVVEKRTKSSLDDEQAMREALRYQELLDAGMMTLTPDVLMAWSEGVGTLEDDPLIFTMLNDNGKLMSKSEAARQGLPIKDLYDDAVWLPPQFYAKGGGIMPDVMANNLGFDTASEMWAALESSIKSHRSAKEGYAKAEAAVKAVEQQAREQAKTEAAAWRQEADDMQADDWSPRESLVRDMRVLNVALSAFPPEVRAKVTGGSMVKLAGLATERARYKAIQKALEKAIVETEAFMRKEYTEQVDEALDSYRSQKDSSGRISGKLPSQYTELVDYAYRIREASIEDQATESGGLEKALEESESDQQTQSVLTKMGILRLFEAWEMKDSTAMAAASEWLSETIENGKLGRKLLDEDRKAMLDDFRATAKKDAVPEGKISKVDVDNETNNVRFKVFRRAWQGLNGMLDSAVHTIGQRLELVFGENSKITDHFITSFIQAANASNDIKREVNRKYHDMLSVVFNSRSRLAHARGIGQMQKVKASGIMITEGRVVEETKLDIETLTKLADGTMTAESAGLRQDQVDAALEEFAANSRKRTVTVETVKNAGEQKERQMTELQGLQWWLWSRQDASRKQMERDGWTEESFAQLDAFLSPEAKALGEWIAKGYDDAARLIDPVYRRLFRAPLPRVKNYAPIYRNRSGDASVMDLDDSDISSGLSAGFTKSRVNTISPLAEMDAVTVMLTHWENVAHWVTHAEAVRDAKAVLLDRDVMTAIKQSSGNVSANSIKQRIAAIESQGTNAAKELHDLNRFWRWLMQYRAFKGLAFRISPVIKQTPALLNPLLADVPVHAYTVGLARAFYDPNAFNREVAEMFKSDTIMRRIEGGFSAEARITMQGEGAIGSVALALMQKGMMPMSWTDGGWTALGAAVSYDYYKRGYMSENPKASTAMADAYATRRLEKMIAVSAQPSDIVNRSLVEASSNNFMRSLWMFASDQRKALGIEVTALKKLLSGKSKNKAMDVQRILVAHFAQTAMSQLMASIMASFLGDDEDKEREWSREQWTLSLALGPINGLFVLGRMIDMTGRRILNMQAVQDAIGTGVKLPIFTNKTLFEQGVNDIWNGATSVDDLFNPEDPDDFIGAMESLTVGGSTAMSMAIGPQAGVIDVTANLVREGNKVIKAMSDEK